MKFNKVVFMQSNRLFSKGHCNKQNFVKALSPKMKTEKDKVPFLEVNIEIFLEQHIWKFWLLDVWTYIGWQKKITSNPEQFAHFNPFV